MPVGTSAMGDCYTPNKPGTHGYAQRSVWNKELKKTQSWKLHRWVFTQVYGEIPEGFEIDHICHNEAVARGECAGGTTCKHRACANPNHLRAVSKSENQKSGLAGFANRKYCESRGHALTEDNIHIDSYGRPTCKACKRYNTMMAQRAFRARKKAMVA